LTQIVHPHAIFFAFSLLGLALGVLTATIDGTNSGWLNHYRKADSRSHHLQKGPKTWITIIYITNNKKIVNTTINMLSVFHKPG
jgi:hypothetical protein